MTAPFNVQNSARLLSEHSQHAAIFVAPDGPTWTVLDANPAYLAAMRRRKDELVGQGLFTAFSEGPATPTAQGASRIRDLLEAACARERTVCATIRYDVSAGQPGEFAEHFWEMTATPIHDSAGALCAILHEVTDVTSRELAERDCLRLRAELEAQSLSAKREALELAQANRQLQETAVELEAQTEELLATAAQLEERTEESAAALDRAERERTRVEDTLESMGDAHFLLDRDFRFVRVNSSMERVGGLPKSALLGRTIWEMFPGTVGTDFEHFYRRASVRGMPAHFTHDYSDGRLELVAEVDVYPADNGGVAVFGRDVTARVQAEALLRVKEEELQTFADAIPTLAWSARADGWIEWYNAQWYAYTGTTLEDMQGWGWQSVHHPESLPIVLEEWTKAIATGQPFEMTFPLRGADGRFRPFLTRVNPVRGPDETVQRWFGTNTNIEVEHAARQLAEEANLAKTTFLATMSHELRTPLNALSGYLDILLMELRGPLTDAQRADLQRMQRSQRHLTSLINDVLNFATLDVGHTEFTIAPVNVGDVLRDVEEFVSPQCAAKKIHCELEIPSPGPTAAADRERVAQILLNVLANAVKYTEPSGRIHASCDATEQEVRVIVTDSGRGIPRDQLERIFDPFVQVERRLNSAAGDGGVGLGLAISRSLAEGMNGSLTAESELGVGSSFTLLLPLLRPPAT
jgi:PAS domain S-box-containing protein